MSTARRPRLADGRLYFRQWLSGRDFASDNEVAQAMVNYAYALGDREAGTAVLVDPAHAPLELLRHLADDDMTCAGVVLTHFHADHAGGALGRARVAGVAELVAATAVPVHLHRADRDYLLATSAVAAAALETHEDGDVVSAGALEMTLLHTPGHTPGSQCLATEDLLLTGDTLFLLGCGRTDTDGGDPAALYESLTTRLGALPDEAIVYPGHAYAREPHALLGTLRAENPVLLPMRREEWLARFSG